VPGARFARLCYEQLASIGSSFLLAVYPATGRHHQIRVQLASLGCPIRGDRKYGSRITGPGGFVYLHARSLACRHPVTGQELQVMAAPPQADKLWQLAVAAMSSSKHL
jgi:23S rRNA pseudouridine1911/1915/1917 synthase